MCEGGGGDWAIEPDIHEIFAVELFNTILTKAVICSDTEAVSADP